ncbi:MAG TPA: hypothetical protein VG146_19485, partial [Verrucomicrobiae bacterium]|nr:hypothetical protein [Verrucomicrobiae bacterium]
MPTAQNDDLAVPEGHPTIAQRFSVGDGTLQPLVPEGRLNLYPCVLHSAVPPGLTPSNASPTLKRWAILNHP